MGPPKIKTYSKKEPIVRDERGSKLAPSQPRFDSNGELSPSSLLDQTLVVDLDDTFDKFVKGLP